MGGGAGDDGYRGMVQWNGYASTGEWEWVHGNGYRGMGTEVQGMGACRCLGKWLMGNMGVGVNEGEGTGCIIVGHTILLLM